MRDRPGLQALALGPNERPPPLKIGNQQERESAGDESAIERGWAANSPEVAVSRYLSRLAGPAFAFPPNVFFSLDIPG
jgi:hypothetical protein